MKHEAWVVLHAQQRRCEYRRAESVFGLYITPDTSECPAGWRVLLLPYLDQNTLFKVGEPNPNPLSLIVGQGPV